MISNLLSVVLEDYIHDSIGTMTKKWFDKRRYNRFLDDLKSEIKNYCERNECRYLDSSSFEFFIRNTRFIESTIERAVTTKIDINNKEFIKREIKKAREISEKENVEFNKNEERIIKEIYRIVTDRVSDYYQNRLTPEQRHEVFICLKNLVELKDSVNEFKEQSFANDREILDAIKESKLSDTKAAVIAELMSDELFEGRFQEFDSLAYAVKDKSEDLLLFYECLSDILRSEDCSNAISKISRIKNGQVRDIAIKTSLPVLLFRKESINTLMELPSSGTLKEIVCALNSGDNARFFAESITVESGLEIQNYTLNQKLYFEEERLITHIVILFLHDKMIKNIHIAMEEMENGKPTWLTRLLVVDKLIDFLSSNDDNSEINEFVNQIQSYRYSIDGFCKDIQNMYYTVIVKAYLIMNRIDEAEKSIPARIENERPLCDYKYVIKIEKKEIDLEDVYEYSVKNDAYWLLNNYFVSRQNSHELVVFCQKHEELFSKDWPLFFMYLETLRQLGDYDNCQKQLLKYSNELEHVYEYWNELLIIDDSEEIKQKYIDACQEGEMIGLFSDSEFRIIERLLSLHVFDLAELYVMNLEKIGKVNHRIKKYKAIIQQEKKNDIEALKWFKESFEEFEDDAYVIDSIITISLMNKRKIEKRVIDAALKQDTSRLHMLVAACLIENGDESNARLENMRAILRSDASYNQAFGQFMSFEIGIQNRMSTRSTDVDVDTAACCRKTDGTQLWLCVYKERILPKSPYVWNGDYHVHIDDAARLSYLRKQKGDNVEINGEIYEVIDIIPIETYLFRISIIKMTQNGEAKEISIPSKNNTIDIKAFNEWIIQNTPDESMSHDWIEQYNNTQDVPLPLFFYRRNTRCSYLQFVDLILSSQDVFVREIPIVSVQSEKYVISFVALVALYKAGVSPELIRESGGVIMESTIAQIKSDSAEIIKEYDRDTVASIGVFNGKVFYNQVDDNGKEWWLKEAGMIKKYCEEIPVVNSDYDLSGPFFDEINAKDLFGICDYDAISFVMHNDSYSLISSEALLSSLSSNDQVNLRVSSISDWLVSQNIEIEELFMYLKKLMDEGCLMSVSKSTIKHISKLVSSAKDEIKQRVYSKWNSLLSSADAYPEKYKTVFIQALSVAALSFEEEPNNIDRGIKYILMNSILLLRKQRIEVQLNENGYLLFSLVNTNLDEKYAGTLEVD